MAKVLLLQFDTDPACADRRKLLQDLGVGVVEAEPRWPSFFDVVTKEQPDVIVIACSIISSHAIESARYLGDGFNTRNIPVILVDVLPEDRTKARSSAPRAQIVERDALTKEVQEVFSPRVSP